MLILIVERDPQLVELMRDLLESAGHRCQHCGSLADARALLQAPQLPALAIVGERLDDGPGRFVLAEAAARGIATLALTRNLRQAAEFQREGRPHVIHPFQIEEFKAAVETALGRRQPPPQ